ncbi:MAG: M3 family metallopeptidase [Xanthomonadaceae bacterium]|nr:M3 family metallopeptidase [Xanthomonadaceae bacterium]
MTSRLTLSLAIASALALSACSGPTAPNAETETQAATEQATVENPFFQPSDLPYQLPPFDQITDAHYAPAFERGMVEHSAEIAAVADNPEPASFENTIVAMERSGQLLSRVSRVFFNLAGAHTNDAIQAVQAEMAPKLSAHQDAIALNPALFERVEALYQNRDSLGLDPEQKRLLERYRTDFVRAGAQLDDAQKTRLKEINSELATLQTQFSQNVLKEVNASAIVVDSRDELAGLSENQIAAAAKAAAERGMEGKFVVALMNTSGQPPLGALENRPLRERIMRASLTRGSQGGEFDNREILTRVAALRAERALMLGYPTHAAYVLEDQTAGTTEAVNGMLARLAPAAVGNAKREAADLQAMIDAEGGDFELAPWDWDFYAEKVRQERYAFDESQLKPYFEMMNVLENGVFHAANQLYGLRFERRTDLPTYHPDVVVYEVFDADGEPLALFLGDFYARPSKRGGAWMNAYVPQSGMFDTKPVVANHQNIPKPPEGQPTLMTFDEVTTMFHEFGHALHGMFSDVHYPRFSGTSVPRDFVEYPSQVNEMWATWPEILANYAKHHETGEPMPQDLLDKVQAAEQFNQGFSTTEYLAASLLDQAWHQLSPEQIPDAGGLLDFEAAALAKAGVDFAPVPPRYRSTYFSHIIGGYSAGYYSYIWSEVLDADSVEWFKENGGLKRENGDHFRNTLLSQGGSKDAMELFRDFRGRDADITPLLERRGLNRASGD